ncbi:hypothetical protein [Roseococcus microcysteis]|uniref:hypothetical protein n=1 Tax=Roseococcus microcysteis TaxID=2771361 RepID=UPI00168AF8DB|nr:hypothetical protein [Roseococcus microcysteis]
MTPRLLTLPAESFDGYAACLKDVLDLLDRVAPQPAIAHAPALRVVLEERAAMMPGLLKLRRPLPTPAVVRGALTPEAEAELRAWQASNPAPALLSPQQAEWPWTPERDAALLEWGATTQDDVLLLEVVNALPGPRLDSRAAIRTRLDWLRYQADDAAQRAEETQDGLADAVAEATPAAPANRREIEPDPNARTYGSVWTEERKTFAREHGPRMTTRALWEALNRLPGPRIATADSMRKRLRVLGVTTLMPGPAITPDMSEAERTAARAEQMRLLAVASGAADWTPERLALLRAEYATAPTLEDLRGRINAMPGNPIASVDSMSYKARVLGLVRPRIAPRFAGHRAAMLRPEATPIAIATATAQAPEQVAEDLAQAEYGTAAALEPKPDHFADARKMVEPGKEAPPEAPTIKPDVKVATPATIQPPSKVAPPAPRSLKATTPWIAAAVAPVAATLSPWASTNPYRLTEEAEAEALAMLRAGQGAKAMHEEFGGRLDWWQRWCGEKRQEGRAA